jgi:4-hydroxybenzoate polyprenyltransferase
VTLLSGLLGRSAGLGPQRLGTLVGAVLTGQLTIGWSNDLVDARRDRASGRTDKPIATGALPAPVAAVGLLVASGATAALSGRLGRRAGLTHGILVVGSGWAYNLGLKRTRASFAPYAVAFGALPQVPTLCAEPPRPAGWGRSVAGALLGVGAHLLNVLPDLDDDRATGVHGLPHRMRLATLKLAAAACLVAAGAAGAQTAPIGRRSKALAVLGSVPLGVGIAVGPGKVPFYCAAGSAVLDAAVLTAGGRAS